MMGDALKFSMTDVDPHDASDTPQDVVINPQTVTLYAVKNGIGMGAALAALFLQKFGPPAPPASGRA